MNKIQFLIVACLISTTAFGQIRYERVLRNNFWNEGTNIVGIREDNINASNAELSGGYEAGGFKDSYMPESQWNIGMNAKTITHLKRFSMIGSFVFDNKEANNACGSMFVNPGFYPVDVLEFTPGHKTFQTYKIMGGISVDLGDKWRIGGLFDYQANNAAKRKDLRYSSYNMNMKFSPGLMYKGEKFRLGLSLIVARNTETINAEQIGIAANAPFAFFDEGLMIGNYQAWTGSSVHLKEAGVSGTPLIKNAYGLGFQFSNDFLYTDISFSLFKGSAGERQINWYRFRGFEAAALVGLRFDNQSIRLKANWERLYLNETVYDKKVTGGITLIEEYGANPLTNRNIIDIKAEYEYLSQGFELRGALVAKNRQTLTAPIYPLVYTQDLLKFGAELEGLKRFGAIDLKLLVAYHQGSVKNKDFQLEDIVTPSPFRLEEYYNIANEYLTAPRTDCRLSCRYNFILGLYSELEANLSYAFRLKHIGGPLRYGVNLVFGYNF